MRKNLGTKIGEVAHRNPVGLWPYERNGTGIYAQRKYVVIVLKENDGLSFHLVEKISGGLCSHCGSVIRVGIRV